MGYKIKYNVEFGDFTKEELLASECGGCESLVLLSIMGEPLNGEAMSVATVGVTGDNEALTSEQVFEALVLSIGGLNSLKLPEWQADIQRELLLSVRKAKGIS